MGRRDRDLAGGQQYAATASNAAQYPTGSYPSAAPAGNYATNPYATAANPYQVTAYCR